MHAANYLTPDAKREMNITVNTKWINDFEVSYYPCYNVVIHSPSAIWIFAKNLIDRFSQREHLFQKGGQYNSFN